jgi:hypothetical protein
MLSFRSPILTVLYAGETDSPLGKIAGKCDVVKYEYFCYQSFELIIQILSLSVPKPLLENGNLGK